MSIEGLAEIQEEVPRSKPDAVVKGSTDGPEIHDEALVAAETKSIVEVVGVDIGIFIKGDVPTRAEVEEAVRRGSEMLPLQFLTILPTECSQFLFYVINCQTEKTFLVIV